MSKRPSPSAVVDLTLDSDDEQEFRLGDISKNLSYAISKRVKKEGAAIKAEGSSRSVLNYEDVQVVEVSKEGAAIKAEGCRSVVNYEDVQVVQASAPTMVAAAASDIDNDKDILVVGTVNEVNLPHMRHHCTKFQFQPNPSNRPDIQAKNTQYCDLCYCYVCDCPVKDCKSWSGSWSHHCNATDKENAWVLKRNQQKTKSTDRSDDNLEQPRRQDDVYGRPRAQNINRRIFGFQWRRFDDGPWRPDHSLAPTDPDLTKCRKCSWYSKLNEDPWCHKCGRVASNPTLLQKAQSVAYVPKSNVFCLGVKKIPFRIVPRNVQSMQKYQKSWSEADNTNSAWIYDESEMEEDVFQHRLGTHPTIKSILSLISIYEAEKLGEFAANGNARNMNLTEKDLEGIVLENPSNLALLRVLHTIDSFGLGPSLDFRGKEIPNNSDPAGDITAKWFKETHSGIITIRVFLPKDCLCFKARHRYRHDRDSLYNRLLGAWFDCFPFNLVALTGPLKAKQFAMISSSGKNETLDAAAEKMKKAVTDHNDAADSFSSQLSLTCSSGHATVGGITDNDTTIKMTLQRFFRETWTDHFGRSSNPSTGWIQLEKGAVSKHRSVKHDMIDNAKTLDLILNFKDYIFAKSCLTEVQIPPSTTSGLMEHLENLGHESEVHLEGLQCELLPFQKQSLKWALEREKVDGGIQRYFWMKVPVQDGWTITNLYYNPILQCFRNDKPHVVRGGIIAEEMGLGKTIISLALILKNPAPEFPISGSPIASLSSAPEPSSEDASKWDEDVIQKMSTNSPRRASILSRGTLVICPVSLVGQWIEEAKSKLEDPGLIYPYHGGHRKRDANILARNAIVVTTYQVLASDHTYHRAKSEDSNYCPPLEQIRWWRIICDEGHSLREATTKRNQSICNLVADHKWLVSGTPINTSITDLKNQLKFLGIEKVEELFSVCCSTSSRHRHIYGEIHLPSELLFFLRSVMMRHRQNQTYRGTGTTLMSLPQKTERSIEVTLTKSEKEKYDVLNADAKDFYVDFKAAHVHDLSSYYLKLSQKLTPMRVACSGGFFPLEDEDETDADEDNYGDAGEDKGSRGRKKKVVKYSDFAFTSKFKVLLSELERIRQEDPTSKSLVFSQYSSTLNWLKEELPKHGFQFRTLSGNMSMNQRAKALHDFQSDPPTTIFLLSMRAGNCGINLTQANCVFLMEPGFNPALEQQAIGRVHRLGQKREVEVVRLLVKDSIETRICTFLEKKYHSTKANDTGEEDKDNAVAACAVGNIATEKPKSKILAEEFDILFGVKHDKLLKPTGKRAKKEQKGDKVEFKCAASETEDDDMPDAAVSSCFI